MVVTSNTELLATKPEILFPFDDSRLAELLQMQHLAVGEMAGRDSVAAILLALESDDVAAVLPIAVYTGTEYGDWRGFERNAQFLRRVARERFGKEVLDLVWMGSPQLWRALNGRHITDIVRWFGAYSPCLACHFYLHAVRISLAVQLGIQVVIGGDRERHDDRAKINQLCPVVDAYQRLFRRFGLELREPLRAVADTADLEAVLGPSWPGGSPQPTCLFSGNYHPLDGRQGWTEADVMAFVDGFVYPVLEHIVAELVADRPVAYEQVVRKYLSSVRPS
jgi:hypothetical protein